ncbi:Male sterility protein, putative [Ricinus communis]|uniref:Fatty acyl-CoA reductase n=1 Tax=Ricinus communis TaxID=3988 RepID=B9T853_RICCO|nr:Male sterility protein, putative [Ricinus communis]
MEILKTEIINADVFKCLKQKYGQSYQNFMLSKLVPVVGNICESDLGLEATMANVISREVHVIINSAANTRFNERYDVSIDTNTRGTYHLMNFAKYCKNLSLFLQISSAYANGPRKGIIMEKKFSMGDTITGEKSNSENRSTSLPILNVEKEIQLAFDAIDTFQDNSLTQNLKKLGLERAERYGWHDTYAFTKAMGEMIIDSMRGEIPVVIIRPSIIESTYRDPFPGWIQGNRMLDPLMVYYGKGQLTCFLADPNCVVDIVPADTVVNATLAAVAKHGMTREPVINIYQVGSSVVNPLTLQELVTLVFEHFKCNPFLDSKGNPINVTAPMKLCTSVEEFSTHLKTDVAKQREFMAMEFKNSKRPEIYAQKLMELVRQLATIYKPYGFYKGRFDCSNLQGLMENMSEEEKIEFGFDVKSIDWGHYIKNVHVPGLRMHVMQSHKM